MVRAKVKNPKKLIRPSNITPQKSLGHKFHYHQGLYSLLKEEPLSELIPLRCLCLANLNHTGPDCLVRFSLHLVFGLPRFLVQTLGVHSVTY